MLIRTETPRAGRTSAIATRITLMVVLGFGSLWNMGCGGDELNESLTKDEIRISVGELRTFAGAEAMACEQFAATNTSRTFFIEQTAMIREKLTVTRKDLVAPSGQLDGTVQKAAALGEQLEKEFAGLQSDPNSAAGAPDRLKKLAAEAKELETAVTD